MMKSLQRWFALIVALSLAAPFPGAVASTKANEESPQPASVQPLPSFSEPGISPDGQEIAFVSGGDIWTVPSSGGEARLLISHPALESRPLYSPDGKMLAFVSTRTGNGDVYALNFATGLLTRLTYDDAPEQLSGWSSDSRWVYFTSTSHDIAGMNDIYRVSASSGTPMAVSADVYANEFFAAPSPDGRNLAFSARGIASAQWWRKGRSHLDEAEIWLLHDGATPSYERLSEPGAKELWPLWTADGRGIYYVSDRSGAQNIWNKSLNGAATQVTQFTDGRLLWPSISKDGKTIAFERDFGIWKLDTSTGRAEEVHITRVGVPATPSVEHLTLTNQFRELQLSPDGKKLAFVAQGQIFASSAKEEGTAFRVTRTDGAESGLAWAPDSKRMAYASDRDGVPHLFLYDFTANKETQLTHDGQPDCAPRFSPDGKRILFERGTHELRTLELENKKEVVLATGEFGPQLFIPSEPYAWSPDGRWVAFLRFADKGFLNVAVVPSEGGTVKDVSFLANTQGDGLLWNPEGTALFFATNQRTEPGLVARIDLTPRAPKFREDQFRDLFTEDDKKSSSSKESLPGKPSDKVEPVVQAPAEAKSGKDKDAAKKPPVKAVEIVFEGIRQRLRLLPVELSVDAITVSPDGKTLLVTAQSAGQTNLYTYSIDELAKEPPVARQVTSTPGRKTAAQFSPDGKEVFFLEQGRISVVTLESRQVKPLAVTAELDVDFAKQKEEMFRQAWTFQRDTFFDPAYNGVDWNAVRASYEPRIAGASNVDDVRRLLTLMVGELNASHSGINAPQTGPPSVTGRLAVRFDRAAYENAGRLRITEIVPLGPVALAKDIHIGDELLAVDGQSVGAGVNLDALLEHKVDKRVALTVKAPDSAATPREVIVRPVNLGTEKNLRYRQWVEERRAYVDRLSKGRLGYAHMPDMSAQSLAQLYVDLDAENQTRQGVVIDVRNNNGGFVNVYAIDVLARQPYLNMTVRGLPTAPARSQLGQRALERPTILVTNQHSLSDAEDFTEGYRTLHLGKVVGEPTAGWIIYTSGATLIDGTTMRMPFIRITTTDGSPMEMHPRPVDIPVTRPIGESYSGRDSQLDTAVRELLQQIDGSGKR
jgi:tricorn protease